MLCHAEQLPCGNIEEPAMAITDWPTEERPREKLLQRGPAALSDAALLAIYLRTGVRGKTAVDLARDLKQKNRRKRTQHETDQTRFCAGNGLGEAKYVQLLAVLEMGRRHLFETLKRGKNLKNPADTRRFLQAQLRRYPYEVFACLFLDNRHRVIEFQEMFRGTIDNASVHPREVVRHAIALNAAAVIFAHNHPSGIAEPSAADYRLTRQLRDALALGDVRVLDHMVVGDGDTVSLAERGEL